MHTFADPLKRAVQMAANRPAAIHDGAVFTYEEFHRRCGQLVAVLRELGIRPGERVAILANTCNQYLETYVGVPAAGMVVVPLNTRHAEPELRYALEDSGSSVLLTDRDPGVFADVVDHVISIPGDYEAHLENAEPAALGAGVVETDLAGLFYTGGTTGLSKGVMLSHRNLIANTFNWLACVPQFPNDRSLIMAPLFHAAGSNGVLGAIWNGSCQITLGVFDPGAALDLIAEHGVTETLAVPTMLAAIAEEQHARPRNVDSLRLIAHGGSPIATEIIRRTISAFPAAEMIEVYGATELSPLATVLLEEHKLVDDKRGRSCGRPMVGNEILVLHVLRRQRDVDSKENFRVDPAPQSARPNRRGASLSSESAPRCVL